MKMSDKNANGYFFIILLLLLRLQNILNLKTQIDCKPSSNKLLNNGCKDRNPLLVAGILSKLVYEDQRPISGTFHNPCHTAQLATEVLVTLGVDEGVDSVEETQFAEFSRHEGA